VLKARLGLAATIIVATMIPVSASAACSSPPPATSTAGQKLMLQTPFIVLGTIDKDVPADAHGAFSLTLNVTQYLKGSGTDPVEVTDNANGEVPLSGLQAGGSTAASATFLDAHAGQQALVFASPAPAPYEGQLVTGSCTYTVYTTAEVSTLLPKVRAVLGAGKPLPKLRGTGVALAVFALAGVLILAGAATRWAGARLPREADLPHTTSP
jgi:hypothetical protein